MGFLKALVTKPNVQFPWKIVRSILESLQLLSVFLTKAFGWPQDIVNTLGELSIIRIDVTNDLYISLFFVACSIISLYFLFSLLFILIGDECCDCDGDGCDEISDFIWFFIGEAILFGILFIPVASFLLEMLHCVSDDGDSVLFKNNSLECGSGEHVGYAIWACFALLIIILGTVLRGITRDLEMHQPSYPARFRSDIHYLETKYILFRFLTIIFGLILFEVNPILSSVLVFVTFSLVLWYTMKWIPYVDMKYNYIRCAMDSFNCWMSFSVFISTVIDNNQSWAAFVIWCCFPFFVIICCIWCNIRLKSRPLTKEDLRIDQEKGDLMQDIYIDNPYLKDTMLNHEIYEQLSNHSNKCMCLQPDTIEFLFEKLESKEHKIIQSKEKYHYDWKCIYAIYQRNYSKSEQNEEILLSGDQMAKLCDIISHCPDLVVLRLNKWNINKERLFDLLCSICKNPHSQLRIIDLANNQIDINGATMILNEIKKYQSEVSETYKQGQLAFMKTINLQSNHIGISEISEKLTDNHPLGSMVVI